MHSTIADVPEKVLDCWFENIRICNREKCIELLQHIETERTIELAEFKDERKEVIESIRSTYRIMQFRDNWKSLTRDQKETVLAMFANNRRLFIESGLIDWNGFNIHNQDMKKLINNYHFFWSSFKFHEQ